MILVFSIYFVNL